MSYYHCISELQVLVLLFVVSTNTNPEYFGGEEKETFQHSSITIVATLQVSDVLLKKAHWNEPLNLTTVEEKQDINDVWRG